MTHGKHTWILGVSAFYHDSAAALLKDGEIVAAGSEERFTRKKGDSAFPSKAVEFCLKQGGITLDDLSFSLAHMHVNRLVHASGRAHELVIYEFLERSYQSMAARARASSQVARP